MTLTLSGPGVAEALRPFAFATSPSIADIVDRGRELGACALTDLELLALQLSGVCGAAAPSLAADLMAYYGSLGRICGEPQLQFEGVAPGPAALAMDSLREILRRLAFGVHDERRIFDNWLTLSRYLLATLAARPTEVFRVMYLDSRNQLIREVDQVGTVNIAPVFVREVAHNALSLGAQHCILVHNHPSGCETPSRQDIELTLKIKAALKTLEIALHDHVLVAGDKTVSFKSLGLL